MHGVSISSFLMNMEPLSSPLTKQHSQRRELMEVIENLSRNLEVHYPSLQFVSSA